MFAKRCKYDSRNFEHSCMITGKPCSHLENISDCPYLANADGKKLLKKKIDLIKAKS